MSEKVVALHKPFAPDDPFASLDPEAGLADDASAIESLARDVSDLRAAAKGEGALPCLGAIEAEARILAKRLHKHRRQSLYDLQVLQRALEGAPPEGD